jgi:chitodextrinase
LEVYDGDITWGDISVWVTTSSYTPGTAIPYDTIYWKVRAEDRAGNISAYSAEWHFALVNNAPSQPGQIVISGVTSNSATMSWGASTDQDGDTVSYEIEYGVNNTLTWTSAGSTTSTSRALSGLVPATTYVVRVRAIDGKGGISSWREFDPAFTTRAVKEILSAYWLPPLSVPEGTLVTMRAEVYGYTAGTSVNFTIYEDDGLLNDDTVKVVEILLSESFANYQKIILTHELGFFREFRRMIGAGHPDWYFVRLEGNPKASITCQAEKTEIQKAEEYLHGHKLDEAAICLRKAAEDTARRYREWAEKKKLPPGEFFSLTENLRAA